MDSPTLSLRSAPPSPPSGDSPSGKVTLSPSGIATATPTISISPSDSTNSQKFLSTPLLGTDLFDRSLSVTSHSSSGDNTREQARLALYGLLAQWGLDKNLSIDQAKRQLQQLQHKDDKALAEELKNYCKSQSAGEYIPTSFKEHLLEQAIDMANDDEEIEWAIMEYRTPIERLTIRNQTLPQRAQLALFTLVEQWQSHGEDEGNIRKKLQPVSGGDHQNIATSLQGWPFLKFHMVNPHKLKGDLRLRSVLSAAEKAGMDTSRTFLDPGFINALQEQARILLETPDALQRALDPELLPLEKVTPILMSVSPASSFSSLGSPPPWEGDLIMAMQQKNTEGT